MTPKDLEQAGLPPRCEVVDKGGDIPAWAQVKCGTMGSADDDDDGEVYELFCNVACSRCGHSPCPCCEQWCDMMITVDTEDGVEPCACFDTGCSYPEPVRWFARRTGISTKTHLDSFCGRTTGGAQPVPVLRLVK